MKLGTYRFPGGSLANTYHWQHGIGPVGGRSLNVGPWSGQPFSNEYGVDEHMFSVESLGSEANITVNFATGTPLEAANWVEYMNAEVGENPNGGVDWARVRADSGVYQHYEPYNITYWEVDNELYMEKFYSWTHDVLKYVYGGCEWQTEENVVKAHDWRLGSSISTGDPHQIFYVKYPPVAPDSIDIHVGNDRTWRETEDINSCGPGKYYQVVDPSGKILFGDGDNGDIPPAGDTIKATYESGPHGGFVDFYAAMKVVDPRIRIGSCFPDSDFIALMGDSLLYDFIVEHSYYSSFRGDSFGSLEEFHAFYMQRPLVFDKYLRDKRATIEAYAPSRSDSIEILVTEYNMVPPRSPHIPVHYGRSLGNALYVADFVKYLILNEIPLANVHHLISTGDEPYGWEPTALISPNPDFILNPAGYVLHLYTRYFGEIVVKTGTVDCPSDSIYFDSNWHYFQLLDEIAGIDGSGIKGSLLVVNKDPGIHHPEGIVARIELSGFMPSGSCSLFVLSGDSISSINTVSTPYAVSIAGSVISVDASFSHTFPPHCMTLFRFSRTTTVAERNGKREQSAFELYPNNPNPFKGETVIRFQIPAEFRGENLDAGDVSLKIYNLAGQLVRSLSLSITSHRVRE